MSAAAPVPAPSAPTSSAWAETDPQMTDVVMSADGIGPYRIGTRVSDLRAAGLLGETSSLYPACQVYSAHAVGAYHGNISLVLRHDVLAEVSTGGGDPIRSPEGAKVGSSWDEIYKLYGARGSVRTASDGTKGFAVPVGNNVMLFAGHPIRPGVGAFAVGFADYTLRNFLAEAPC